MSSTSVLLTAPPTTAERAAPCRFEIQRGAAGLAAVRVDWQRLCDGLGGARCFQRPEWYESYLRSLADGELCFCLARRNDLLVGVFPVVQTTRTLGGLRLRSLELVNHPHLLLADCVFAPTDANRRLLVDWLAFLRHEARLAWDVVVLANLLEDGCALPALRAGPRAADVLVERSRCDYLPCVPLDELAAGLSRNFRGNLRKARNKLQKLSGLEYVAARRPAELDAALSQFLEVEASGWKGATGTGTAIQLQPRVRAFYRALVDTFGRSGACEINLLRAERHCLAGQFCLRTGDTSFMLKIGYDEAYAPVAPGNMLLEYTLRRYVDAGDIKSINLVTDADWHASWKPQSLAVSDVYLFNQTIAGLTALGLTRVRQQMGRAYRARLKPLIARLRNGHARAAQTDPTASANPHARKQAGASADRPVAPGCQETNDDCE